MAEITMLRSTFRLLLLLTVLVLAAVGSKNEQASLDNSSGFATTPRSTNDNSIIVTATRENESEKSSSMADVAENASAKNVPWDDEEDEDGEEEEEEEDDDDDEEDDDEDEDKSNENGDEVDEYEDELKGIAESHEAMSRDERRAIISSTTSSANLISVNRSFVEHLVGTRNFDSRENVDGIISDESSISNEALPKNDDDEVAQLLRYKQKVTSLVNGEEVIGGVSKLGTKVKRVPTVKKELSTQKEIITSNETQLTPPKTLISHVEIVNRLDDETIKNERKFGVPVTSRDNNRYELVREDTSQDEEYSDIETPRDILRKLDKRQPSEFNILKSYFLDGHSSEREQRRKLRELGIEEGALAESLMELLTRLAEDPRLREGLHRILEDVERDLSFNDKSLLDSQKRAHSSKSLVQMSLTDSATETLNGLSTTTKKPKKKKKKRRKKKPRHRLMNTTLTMTPTTIKSPIKIISSPAPSPLTTTATNWPATTQPQWRLVAERLFGSPWSTDRHESPSSMTKVRSIKDRFSSIDDKQRDNLKTLNDERQALMLQSAREYSQPRRLHYGKVNTHEKSSSLSSSHDSTPKNYDSERENHMLDYDLSDRSYQPPIFRDRYDRYGQYGRQRIRNYDRNPLKQQQQQQEHDNDYDEIFPVPEGIPNNRPFARTQQFRPLGREYASTKTWQDSHYDYSRPWNEKSRTNFDDTPRSNGNWPWRSSSSSDYKIFIPRYRAWSRGRNYWRRLGNVENELDEIENDEDNEDDLRRKNWQRNQPEQHSWPSAYHDDSSRWQNVDRNVNTPNWQIHERPKSYSREMIPSSLEKNKNPSELINDKETIVKSVIKDKPIVPKITMKTWNSLTSDPATWPFKLTGAKPWPKDKNGKSYNPNAELVRKLGLDKQQDHLLSSNKDNLIGKEIVSQNSPKYKIKENSDHPSEERNEIGTIVNSAKSSISWPDKLSAVNEWSSDDKSREENENLQNRDEMRPIWQTNGADGTDRKIWSNKSPISPKISSVGAWVMPADESTWRPYELKHTAYGQLSEVPNLRWNDEINSKETDARSWSMKNEPISASWSQKINNNDWNVAGSVYSPEKTVANPHSSTWPSKWRQFAYHKVTAAPITKIGSSNVADPSNKPRNSYIAVSAVSAPKYSNNEWRKNDIEETQLDRSAGDNHPINFDRDDANGKLRKSSGNTNERWNKQARIGGNEVNERQTNRNDPLEHQLEELRQIPYWNQEQMLHEQSQKRSNNSGFPSMTSTTQSSGIPSNSSIIIENESVRNHEGNNEVTMANSQETKKETK